MSSLRVQADQAVLPGILHDQGSADKDPYIVSVLQPSSIEEFSGAMRFIAVISENGIKKFTL